MINKIFFSFLLSLVYFGSVSVNAQLSNCGFEDPDPINSTYLHNQLNTLNQAQVDEAIIETQYIPIKAHLVQKNDGTGGLTVEQVEAALVLVNQNYSSVNMEFFLCGEANEIPNSAIYDLTVNTDPNNSSIQVNHEDALFAGNNDEPNVINVYFFHDITKVKPDGNTSNPTGYAYYPSATPVNRVVLDSSGATNISTFSHELGHFFGLYHTHGRDNGCGATEELVNGDEENCKTTGDGICDTPADPNLSHSCIEGSLNPYFNCEYTGNEVDSNGDTYTPLTDNVMSYAYKECRTAFTFGQLERAVCTAITARSYLDSGACPNDPSLPPPSETVDCPEIEELDEDVFGEETYLASEEITASNTIVNGADVTYSAGNLITLENGFHAYSASDFLAVLDGCDLYCTPSSLDAETFYINSVYFPDISFAHISQSDNGYGDYTDVEPLEMETGGDYDFLLVGGPEDNFRFYIKVWIDLNEDNDFDDEGELLLFLEEEYTSSYDGSISIPNDVEPGTKRMRIVLSDVSMIPEPCDELNHGEFQDYLVNIGLDYCTPEPYVGYVFLSNMKLFKNTNSPLIDNNTSADINSTNIYTDFTSVIPPADLNYTDTYTIDINAIFADLGSYPLDWRVWIDYNQDNDFIDDNELVLDFADVQNVDNAFTGSFTVPSEAINGLTRMRVGVFSDPAPVPPCADFVYGEFEDYAINLDPNAERLANNPMETNIENLNEEFLNNIAAFPNPLSDFGTIEYHLKHEMQVSVAIYSLQGNLIQTLVNKERQGAGKQQIQFNVSDLPNGAYYYHIHTGYKIYSDKLIIMR